MSAKETSRWVWYDEALEPHEILSISEKRNGLFSANVGARPFDKPSNDNDTWRTPPANEKPASGRWNWFGEAEKQKSPPDESGGDTSLFPTSDASREFYRRKYPGTTASDWNDWRWQVRSRIRTLEQLEHAFQLSCEERAAVACRKGSLPVGITPYYASLMGYADPDEPLRRTHIPTLDEFVRLPGEDDDPLAEDKYAAVPGIVHRYPDRALFLTTGFCGTYCRYCTRSRMVGNPGGEYEFSVPQWEKALGYLEEHVEVRDVLLSGGDPLTLGDEKLDSLLTRLRKIKHIEFLRIGTKIPMVLPMRITAELVKVLRKHARHPLWMSIHVTHPSEITPEAREAAARLADAGIPLGSQTVLLKDINDSAEVMKRLMHMLLTMRIKPYYLYQCDPIQGSGHFRTPVHKGLEIIQALRGHTTGYACPMFVIDAPGGGGKIQLAPDPVVGRDGDDLLLRNFEGKVFRYPDPNGRLGAGGQPRVRRRAGGGEPPTCRRSAGRQTHGRSA